MAYHGRYVQRLLKREGSKASSPSKAKTGIKVGDSKNTYPRIDLTIEGKKVSFRLVIDPAGVSSIKKRVGSQLTAVSLAELGVLRKRLASLASTSSMDLTGFS